MNGSNSVGKNAVLAVGTIACFIVALFAAPAYRLWWDSGVATIEGEVKFGEVFSKHFGREFQLRLDPIGCGWVISVRGKNREVDLSRLTPAFHFVPNPRYIEGWHFRNADNTGPNQTGPLNVNAPQTLRKFMFSRDITPKTPRTREELERVRAAGGGELEIRRYTLSPPKRGEKARMMWMEFKVRLEWN